MENQMNLINQYTAPISEFTSKECIDTEDLEYLARFCSFADSILLTLSNNNNEFSEHTQITNEFIKGVKLRDQKMLCSNFCNSLCHNIKLLPDVNNPIEFLKFSRSPNFNESILCERFVEYNNKYLKYNQANNSFMCYNNGVWQIEYDTYVKGLLDKFSKLMFDLETISMAKINGAFNRLKSSSALFIDTQFKNNNRYINLLNGMYDLCEERLRPHSPEYLSTHQFGFTYNENANCPLFKDKLSEILSNRDDVIDYVKSLMLYFMLETYEDQKIFIFTGKGRNGKSLLANLFTEIIGNKYVAHQHIENLANGKHYSVFQLMNKLLNISSESGYEEIDTNILKNLSGGDKISARQIREKPVQFSNHARILILTNSLPVVKSIDQAFLDRLRIVDFRERFDDPAKMDPNLLNKLKSEIPGIFNYIKGMYREMYNENTGILLKTPEEIRANNDKFKNEMDSFLGFYSQHIIVDPNSGTQLKDIYTKYSEYCKEFGIKRIKPKMQIKSNLYQYYNHETNMLPYVKDNNGIVQKSKLWTLGVKLRGNITVAFTKE